MDVSEETNRQAYGAGVEWIRGRDGSKIRQETYPSPEQEMIAKDRGVQDALEARKTDAVYRWRVFKEQAKRRSIQVGVDEL